MQKIDSHAYRIATESFAGWLGIQLIDSEENKAIVKLPYARKLGVGRVHGGAISALVDVAATAAFWSTPLVGPNSRGATVGFNINFLQLAVQSDLVATAIVRRRGGTLCTGIVVVEDTQGQEIAFATVTYKLQHLTG